MPLSHSQPPNHPSPPPPPPPNHPKPPQQPTERNCRRSLSTSSPPPPRSPLPLTHPPRFHLPPCPVRLHFGHESPDHGCRNFARETQCRAGMDKSKQENRATNTVKKTHTHTTRQNKTKPQLIMWRAKKRTRREKQEEETFGIVSRRDLRNTLHSPTQPNPAQPPGKLRRRRIVAKPQNTAAAKKEKEVLNSNSNLRRKKKKSTK